MVRIRFPQYPICSVIITFVFLLTACNQSDKDFSQKDVETISVDLKEAESNLNMSNFFSGIKYIPLQTPNKRPIGRIRKIMPQDKYIALYDDAKQSVWVFTYEGKYVNEINIPEGRGPGEIIRMNDVIFTEEGNIHALGAYKIVEYDMDGEFINATEFKFFIYAFSYNSSTEEYLGYTDNSLNRDLVNNHAKQNLIYFDKEGNILESFLPIKSGREEIGFTMINNFPEYRDQQLFSPHLIDTVYSLHKSAVTPKYFLDFGNHATPPDVFGRRGTYSNVVHEWKDFFEKELIANNYVTFMQFFVETQSYIFFRIGTGNEQYNVLHNKKTNETNTGPEKLTNDIDFGYVPVMYEGYDNALYSVIEANDILRHVNRIYDNERGKYRSPKMEKYIKLAHSLPENSNPVLQILEFKSQ